ncbi:tRNA and rRNA cytosine-C5-methylases [Clostridium sp. CAG:356]|nr:tRNA and rRNA cytosine-C5-methylases [Clostridium sp. CAG:356]
MEKQIPEFLNKMLIEQYGEEIANKIIEGYLKQRYVTLRVNTIKATNEEIKQELKNANIEYEEVEWYKDALIIKNVRENEIRKMLIYEEGKIYLQSLSSMLPPIALEPKEGENILDMAAAPGGKTTQIAAITSNGSYITACEKNKIRAERLKYNLQKQGVTCANVMTEDARQLSDYFSFDKILLDAPCSGSGTENVFENNFSEELIKRSCKAQENLLRKALNILKPGGEMIYSTCSILKKENEEIIGKVLKNNEIEIVPIKLDEQIPLLPVTVSGTICVCPTELYEGFFVAKLKKVK